jgi:hypothetical protein
MPIWLGIYNHVTDEGIDFQRWHQGRSKAVIVVIDKP